MTRIAFRLTPLLPALLLSLSACMNGGGPSGPPVMELPPGSGEVLPELDLPGVDRPGFALMVNQARSGGGQVAIHENALLSEASELHAADMADHGYFSHTGRDGSSVADRAGDAGYEWRWIAENIAQGFDDEEAVFEAWMASPGHEANIMNSQAVEFGIGRQGGTWVMVLGAPR